MKKKGYLVYSHFFPSLSGLGYWKALARMVATVHVYNLSYSHNLIICCMFTRARAQFEQMSNRCTGEPTVRRVFQTRQYYLTFREHCNNAFPSARKYINQMLESNFRPTKNFCSIHSNFFRALFSGLLLWLWKYVDVG